MRLRRCTGALTCGASPILLVSPPLGVAGGSRATCGTHGTSVIRRMLREMYPATEVRVRAIGGEVIASDDEPVPGDPPDGGQPGH